MARCKECNHLPPYHYEFCPLRTGQNQQFLDRQREACAELHKKSVNPPKRCPACGREAAE